MATSERYNEIKKRLQQQGSSVEQSGSQTKRSDRYNAIKSKLQQGGFSTDVDEAYVNSFLSDARAFVQQEQKDYAGLNYQTATSKDMQASRAATRDDLTIRAGRVRTWLNTNKSKLDSDTYTDLIGQLDGFYDFQTESGNVFRNASAYYSQWDTEEDYNAFAASQKDYEDKLNLDTDAAAKELVQMERDLQAYQALRFATESQFAPDAKDAQALADLQKKYGDVADLSALITQKRAFLTDASRIQEGVLLAGVADPASDSYDPDFKVKSGYVSTEVDGLSKLISEYGMGYDDLTYEYINGGKNGMRNEILRKTIAYNAGSDSLGKTQELKLYDNMTDDEILIYNYHYATGGKDAAQKYLDSIQETLNYRSAQKRYGKLEGNTALELLFGVEAGLDQFDSGVKSLFSDGYAAPSDTQILSGMVREDLKDTGPKLPDWMGGASLGQAGYDTITTTANMAPSILVSMAVGTVSKTAGAYVGNTLMGASAAGSAYQEKLNMGYTKEQAGAYGLMIGVSEVALEKVLGGITALGGGGLSKVAVGNLSKLDNVLARFAKSAGGRVLLNAGSEALEEGLQTVLEPYLWQVVSGEEVSVEWEEALYSALLGFATGGMFEGGEAAASHAQTNTQTRQIYGDSQKELVAEALEIDPENAFAKKMQAKLDGGKNLSGSQLNKLVQQNETAIKAQGTSVETAQTDTKAAVETARMETPSSQQTSRKTESVTTGNTFTTSEKAASEGGYGASEDGKTYFKGEAVNIMGVASIKDGTMKLKLEDGRTVNAEDVEYGSADEAVVYETVASLGIHALGANMLIENYNPGGKIAATVYAKGIEEAYKLGQMNVPLTEVAAMPFASQLAAYQRQAAYQLGELFGGMKQNGGQQSTSKSEQSGSSTVKAARKRGVVKSRGISTQDWNKAFNSAQKDAYSILDRIAHVTGIDIVLYQSKPDANGNLRGGIVDGIDMSNSQGGFSWHNDKIYIDINSGALKASEMEDVARYSMLRTFTHEFTHFIEKHNAEQWEILRDAVLGTMRRNGVDPDVLIGEYMAAHKGTTQDAASREVVAEAMTDILPESSFVEELAQKHRNVFETLLDKLKEFVDQIRAHFKSLGASRSKEPAAVKQYVDGTMKYADGLVELFDKIAVQAVENYQATEMAQKNTAFKGGVQMQIREIGDTGKFYVQADRQVLTGEDPSTWGKQIEKYINEVIRKEQDIAIPTQDGHVLLLTGRSAYKLSDAHVAAIQKKVEAFLTDESYALKGRAATHIDELIQVAQFAGYKSDVNQKHENDIGEDGFNYFKSHFRDLDGGYYEVMFSAGLNENEETVYSIGSIRKRSFPTSTGSSSNMEALKGGRKASGDIIYTSSGKSQEVKSAIQLAYEKALAKKSSGEQHQDRVGTLTDWDVLERASSIVGNQKLTTEQQAALDSFNSHLERIKNLAVQKAQQHGLMDGSTEDGKKAARNRIAKLNQQINAETKAMFELQNTPVLKKILRNARTVLEEEQAVVRREAVAAYRERRNESQKKAETRRKIRKDIRELDSLLSRGTKKRNVKEGMRDLVANTIASAEVLFIDTYTEEDMIRNGVGVELTDEESKLLNQCVDILAELENAPAVVDEQGMDRWQQTEQVLKDKLAKLKKQLSGVFEREWKRLDGTTVKTIFKNLSETYKELETSEEDYLRRAYDENVQAFLDYHLGDGVSTTRIRDMRLDQLETLHKAYTMVLTTVRNANKNFNQALKQSTTDTAKAVIAEIRANSGENVKSSAVRDVARDFSWKNTKPIYAAERIQSPTLRVLFKALFDGSYKWGADIQEAADFRQSISDKYGFKSWDMEQRYEFSSNTGRKFTLSLDQIMTIYAYSKRAAAHDHMTKGGIQFPKSAVEIVNKNGQKQTFILDDQSAYGLSDEIIGEIISKLTDEQKAFADEMQAYLSDTMGAKGNEVSLALYGIKLFGEKHYFPLRVSSAYLEKAKAAEEMKQHGQISIVNSGFTHAVKPNANKPIIVDGFMGMWADHVTEMSTYHAMALPIEDFRRVYNYNYGHAEGKDSHGVGPTIANAYGSAAMEYIDQLYKDLNGGIMSDPRETRSKKRISNFKKSATMLSMSVAVQQPSSIGRALALIDAKYFVGKRIGDTERGKLVTEMSTYAPIVYLKQMGGFDTNVGSGTKGYLLAERYSAKEWKAALKDEQFRDEAMGWLPAKADEITWCMIWDAAKRETHALNPALDIESEAFLQKAGERFTEVIEKTQVYDSVLSRSSYMRSRSGLVQMMTSFMAEPTTTVNMLEDALRTKDKKKIARTMGAVATSIVLNNLLVSVVYAMRDDDEDETFFEKYSEAFISGVVEDINPLSYYPFLRDINSLFQGYDVERSDMSALNDLADAAKKAVTLLAKDTEYMTDEELAEYHKEIGSALLANHPLR